jgi:hypothetical protein
VRFLQVTGLKPSRLDDYSHELARAGVLVASQRFNGEPPLTRSSEVDAALAALAEWP